MHLINGEPLTTIDVEDRGLAYGDGLFETVRVVDGTPVLLERHLQRLAGGCDVLGIASSAVIDGVRRDVSRLLSETSGRDAVIKIIVTRGKGGRGYAPGDAGPPTTIASCSDYTVDVSGREQGISVYVCDMRLGRNPDLAGLKHLNRLEQVLAAAELPPDCSEGLLCDDANHVIEGIRSNVFLFEGGRLLTPSLFDAGVAGVLRGLLIDTVDVLVENIELDRLMSADEIFMANSVFGIYPVRAVTFGNEVRRFRIGAGTRRLQKLLSDMPDVRL